MNEHVRKLLDDRRVFLEERREEAVDHLERCKRWTEDGKQRLHELTDELAAIQEALSEDAVPA